MHGLKPIGNVSINCSYYPYQYPNYIIFSQWEPPLAPLLADPGVSQLGLQQYDITDGVA